MTIALYAYIDGHFLIVPRRHIRSIKELTSKEWETMRECMYIAKKLIRKVHSVKGMQIVEKDAAFFKKNIFLTRLAKRASANVLPNLVVFAGDTRITVKFLFRLLFIIAHII